MELEIEQSQDGINHQIDKISLENLVDMKISGFLDKIGGFKESTVQTSAMNLHSLIIQQVEKPLIRQVLRRTGGNQVQAAQYLGINRNTLRKKIRIYGIM